jgi:tRNA A37 threonylcarbamoyladenosine synthetase subunit TsaC/SUA5/YrdC
LLGTTLILPDESEPLTDPDEVHERLQRQIELVVDGGACSLEPTSVIDLTDEQPQLIRQGRGEVAMFGL